MSVLIDTNVLVDVIERRGSFFRESAAVVNACEQGDCRGFVAAILFSNAFYILRKSLGRDRAAAAISTIRGIADVAPVTASTIDRAISFNRGDLEDSIQLACAEEIHADMFVTRDRGITHASILIASPDEALSKIVENGRS